MIQTVPGSIPDHLTSTFFADLPIPLPVRAGIAACGFVRATPVQAATLPHLLASRDVAAQAQTGTGKTAAYLISILSRLSALPDLGRSRFPRALVVAPTRELAVQIQEDALGLSQILRPRVVTVFGGLDYGKQRDQLRAGCDLLVGTPGRLLDYEEQGATSFREVRSLVIDEADRLFDMGFIKDLRRIIRRCPPPSSRHSMLFSATLSIRVLELAWEHMNEYVKVEIRPEQITADRVTQLLYHVSSREKPYLLLGLLRRDGFERTLLFVNRKDAADRLVRFLERNGQRVGALTGDIPQGKRLRILSEFKSGRLPLLVATDVASRGLHIEGVSHVVNVDLPLDPEDYVHRIGRTARAGREGKAISLACEDYVYSLDAIQRLIGSPIPVAHAEEDLFQAAAASPKAPPVRSGGPRHLPPDDSAVDEAEEQEVEVAPPPAPRLVAPAVLKPAGPGDGASARSSPTAQPPPPAAPPPVAPAVVHTAPILAEPQGDGDASEVLPVARSEAEFWIREAFAIPPAEALEDAPAEGAVPAAPAGKRKRRRRRRKGKAPEGGLTAGAGSTLEGDAEEEPEPAVPLPSDDPAE